MLFLFIFRVKNSLLYEIQGQEVFIMTENITSNYIDLANAIIAQAAEDYKVLKERELKYGVLYDRDAARMTELKDFFTGKWLAKLTTLDGTYLMKLLDKEVKETLNKT